jgi:hypothetical protein
VLGIGAYDAALGTAQRSTSLVWIPSALVADLGLLTDALDGVDVAATMNLLTSDVAAAVSSYAGLSLRLRSSEGDVELTTLADEETVARVVTSLRVPVSQKAPAGRASVVIVLYATTPGAFVDLAADLAWLTRRALGDVGLDLDLGEKLHAHPATSLRDGSTVDQALGVLLARGRSPEEASADLDALALSTGSDGYAAARELLGALPGSGDEVTSDWG